MKKDGLKIFQCMWLCSVLLLSACATQNYGVSEEFSDQYLEIDSFSDQEFQSILKEMAHNRTLYVFDIDNTLLKHPMEQFFGSDQWYDWQKTVADDSPMKTKCRLQIQGAAYYMAHLVPTEGAAVETVGKLQAEGRDVIALTARSPQFRYPTERELRKNGFGFSLSIPNDFQGYPGYYEPEASDFLNPPRNASYQNGIAMLAGQHKGGALLDLLNRLEANDLYDYIVFVDDKEKNVKHMVEAFSTDPRGAIVVRYMGVDVNSSDTQKALAVSKSTLLSKAYRQFDRRNGCDIGS